MKKKFLLFFISASVIFSQSAGNSGLAFLNIGFGARNIAMGDLGVTTATDVTGLFYNPALISKHNRAQIFLSHNEWIQDLRSEMLGVGFSFLDIPFAIGINTTSVSDIEVRFNAGEAVSSFSAYYFFGSLSSGYEVINDLSLGFSVKYLYEGLLSDEATGWGFDFGLLYDEIFEGLSFGAVVRNAGSMSKLRSQSTKLPTEFRTGLSYKYSLLEFNTDLIAQAGTQKYNSSEKLHFHTGFEITYDQIIALRAGYITGYESKGLTTGMGLTWNRINFDYAYTPFDFNLGNFHTISLIYTF